MKHLKYLIEGREDDIKIIIHKPKLSNDRTDPFWYFGDTAATGEIKLGNKIRKAYLQSTGALKVSFDDDEGYFEDNFAIEKALKLKISDKNLDDLNFIESPHFAIFDDNDKLYYNHIRIYEYDEGIEWLMKACYEYKEKNWKKFGL